MEKGKEEYGYAKEKEDIDVEIAKYRDRRMEDIDVEIAKYRDKRIEEEINNSRSSFLNTLYQIISPLIVLLVFLFVILVFSIIIGLSGDISLLIGGFLIVVSSIFFNSFFQNQDKFLLEIPRFISYVMIILLLWDALSSLILRLENSIFWANAVIVILLVSSLHIRLIKFDKVQHRFTYNAPVVRKEGNVYSKARRYPEVSLYFLFRVEFYLVTMIILFFSNISVFHTAFPLLSITIIIDVIIYKILSKFTNLIKRSK